MNMYARDYEFTYERPNMLYDKKTGDVQILQKEEKPTRAIIKGVKDMERENRRLVEEIDILKENERRL